jgi:hypothetical protein
MERVRDLIREVLSDYPEDSFFRNFEADISGGLIRGREQFAAYDRAFMALDVESWRILKNKAIQHFQNHRKHPDYPESRMKHGFFNQLNDAFAYEYLKQIGFSDIRVLSEGRSKAPDIQYFDAGMPRYCFKAN